MKFDQLPEEEGLLGNTDGIARQHTRLDQYILALAEASETMDVFVAVEFGLDSDTAAISNRIVHTLYALKALSHDLGRHISVAEIDEAEEEAALEALDTLEEDDDDQGEAAELVCPEEGCRGVGDHCNPEHCPERVPAPATNEAANSDQCKAAPSRTVSVNGVDKEVTIFGKLPYEAVCWLAEIDPKYCPSITYTVGETGGTLSPGGSIIVPAVEDGEMFFTVAVADKA